MKCTGLGSIPCVGQSQVDGGVKVEIVLSRPSLDLRSEVIQESDCPVNASVSTRQFVLGLRKLETVVGLTLCVWQ